MSELPPTTEPTQTRLSETADLILATLNARHPGELRTDPREFREALFGELRRRMAAPAGRRRSRELDLAQALRAQGKTFQQIATSLHPSYASWTTWQRQQYRDRLRKGLEARKRRDAGLSPSTNADRVLSPAVR